MSNEDDFQARVQKALADGLPLPDFPEMSPLAGLAMAHDEMCEEFEKAGFTRKEALYLTSGVFNNHPGIAPGA